MLKRRSFLTIGTVFALCKVAHIQESSAATYSNSRETEEWMNQWMGRRVSTEMLHLSRFPERMYYLLQPINWKPEETMTQQYPEVNVPKGFTTDFASIPRIFWSALPPDGEYAYSAILHDYLYWTQRTSRKAADNIFKLSMQEFGVKSRDIKAIYTAVRIGGKGAWDANAAEKKRGERRTLIKFPPDPTTRWEMWRTQNGVFSDE